jgi:hypothetical protein
VNDRVRFTPKELEVFLIGADKMDLLSKLVEKWRDEVAPACTCPPSDETMDSHFHKNDCPNYAWKRRNFQADTATQRKCADELAALRPVIEKLVEAGNQMRAANSPSELWVGIHAWDAALASWKVENG